MSGRIITTILGMGWRFPGGGATAQLFGLLMVYLGTVMAPLGMSFNLLIEDQGLVKVDLSAILDPFDSNWSILCSRAMSFFQKLCPASFSPVSEVTRNVIFLLSFHYRNFD